jgi:rhodanese-related sulfurtransferase/rubrerythrin
MGILDYFKPVDSMSAEEARQFLKTKRPDEYHLIDVRQPREYERGHLPGAILIPLGELPERLKELDPHKTTITYCGSGARSRAAAAILDDNGFSEVFNMSGGIREWEGLSAQGAPESGMAFFTPASTPEELIGLAWTLEEGSRTFYSLLSTSLDDAESRKLFLDLAGAEDHHKASLTDLYRSFSGREPAADFPLGLLQLEAPGDIMEGGMRISKAMEWLKGKGSDVALELAISLESNAYDLSIKMRRRMKDEKSRKVFHVLAAEEKTHLERLGKLLERKV